jgi:hypothetical protein
MTARRLIPRPLARTLRVRANGESCAVQANKVTYAILVITIAVIWAVTILAVSLTLEGTPYARRVTTLMGGGAAATLIPLGRQARHR